MDEKRSEKGGSMTLDDPRRFSIKSGKSGKGDQESIYSDDYVRYPTHVFFIFGNECCERFSYYGLRAVLALYLTNKLMFSEDTAVSISSAFSSLCYFTSIFGAIIADSYLGKFKTILYISIVYACGNIMLAIGSLNIKGDVPISLIALLVIAFGTGGIKPCVSAFGADQFKLPQQASEMAQFFAIFYFSINLGSFISSIITPILRADVSCFGQETCFFAAFGLPAGLFIIAIIVFLLGRSRYTTHPPTGENVFVKCCKCAANALSQKRKAKKQGDVREHWLDYAEEAYGASFVDDFKALLNVIVLYIPIIFYWTLYDQQQNVWVFQSKAMGGKLGSIVMKPDMMTAVNAVLIMIFIPIFDRIVYPVAAKFNCLKNPLNRIGWGGVLVAISFVVFGILELSVEDTYAELPEEGKAHVSFVNGLGCDITLNTDGLPKDDNFDLNDFTQMTFQDVKPHEVTFSVNVGSCDGDIVPNDKQISGKFTLKKEKAASIFLYVDANTKDLVMQQMEDDEKEKDPESLSKVRVYYNLPQEVASRYDKVDFECDCKKGDRTLDLNTDENDVDGTDYTTLQPFEYTILLTGDSGEHIESEDHPAFEQGAVYNVLLQQMVENDGTPGKLEAKLIMVTSANEYHMLLQVPQYCVITAGEMLFSITGYEFSYKQAPPSMKCVVQSCWLLATAIGDLIMLILQLIDLGSKAWESFLYAGLMILDVFFFAFLAYRYKPYQSKLTAKPLENTKEDEGFEE